MLNRFTLGIGLICLSAIGFGLMPIMAIFAYEHQANVVTLLFVRFTIAALIFFALSFKQKPGELRLSKRAIALMFILGGIFYPLESSLYLYALKYLPASLTTLLFYIYPILVALLAVGLGKEKLNRRIMSAAFIGFLGLILVLKTSLNNINWLGVGLAVGAAVVYSGYIIISGQVVQKAPPLITSAYVSLFASISLFLAGSASRGLVFHLDLVAYLSILGIALLSTVLAILCFFAGVSLIGPVRASILSMLEPLVTVACACIFLQESLGWLQAVGGFIVLAGGFLVATEKNKTDNSRSTREYQ